MHESIKTKIDFTEAVYKRCENKNKISLITPKASNINIYANVNIKIIPGTRQNINEASNTAERTFFGTQSTQNRFAKRF